MYAVSQTPRPTISVSVITQVWAKSRGTYGLFHYAIPTIESITIWVLQVFRKNMRLIFISNFFLLQKTGLKTNEIPSVSLPGFWRAKKPACLTVKVVNQDNNFK
uniref:Uncharacterized protein n=1 Tax=uncultured marine virus TaxID=186617 RepID=A0A0F7L3P8_9VIRU|nr:hypothetical protein [uncultured marine virus]